MFKNMKICFHVKIHEDLFESICLKYFLFDKFYRYYFYKAIQRLSESRTRFDQQSLLF